MKTKFNMKRHVLMLSLAVLSVAAGAHASGGSSSSGGNSSSGGSSSSGASSSGARSSGSGANSSSGGSSVQADSVLQAANAAIAKKDWVTAQTILKQALASNAQNADYHNMYAFSMRKGPNPDMKLVFFHYEEALRINPKHRGAHEYIGEAYLQIGDLAKAKEHLAALDKLCRFGCEEFAELKTAVGKYELAHRDRPAAAL